MADTAANVHGRIVSSESEELILVDEQDNVIGHDSKASCHDGDGTLHRAFSLFIFNSRGELLLQKRSEQKRLWPLYWSNSCCSHPRRGETMDEAVQRRLAEELHIECALDFVYKFRYQASYGARGSEHELCWVYVGVTDDAVHVNPNEIADWRYLSADAIDAEMRTDPGAFTPWFKLEWDRLQREFPQRIADLLAR